MTHDIQGFNTPQQCTLCSLLCSEAAPKLESFITKCPRWVQWMHAKPAYGISQEACESLEHLATQVHHLLADSQRSLIWLEGADVLTTRLVVNLAMLHNSVIHIPSTVGHEHVRRVKAFDGWLGTTLAEMAEHSQLIVTLGEQWIHRLPLLARRWISPKPFQSNRQWWNICSDASAENSPNHDREPSREPSCATNRECRQVVWPRESWHHRLTMLHQTIQAANLVTSGRLTTKDPDPLFQAFLNSPHTTIIWEESEFNCPADEVLVHRLLQISQAASKHTVCNLLVLDSDVGRETARSTLMWLTGCQSSAQFDGRQWHTPHYAEYFNLHDWQESFDGCLLIRTTASIEPPSNIQAQVALCSSPTDIANELYNEVIQVATSGMEAEAFLMRGDHGMTIFSEGSANDYQPTGSNDLIRGAPNYPSATEILHRATKMASVAERSK
jgi:hypothetical protein